MLRQDWGGSTIWFSALSVGLLLACGSTSSSPSAAQGGSGETGGTTSAAGDEPGATAGGGSGGAASAGSNSTTGGAGNQAGSAGGSSAGNNSAGNSSAGSGTGMGAGTGTVQLGQQFMSGSRFEASARFVAKDAVSTSDCTQEQFGACVVSTCTENGKTATPPPYAGDITLTDGAMIDVKLSTTPGQSYPSAKSTTSLSGRELVTVSATGGDVPAFSAQIAVPLVITISAPALDANGMAAAPTEGDLALSFDNRAADGEADTQLVALSQGSPSLYCSLPTDTGSATIPAGALAKVRGAGTLILLTSRTKRLRAGDFDVNVITYLSAMNPGKTKPVMFGL